MKTYEKHYPHQEAHPGERTTWTLSFPPEIQIKKIVLIQVGGSPVASFTLDLFNSKKVLRGSVSSGGADPNGDYAVDPDLYRVCDTFQVTGNELIRFYTDGGGLSYTNQDGGSTNKERKIYLEIEIPAGSELDLTTWDVAIGGVIDVG